MYNPIYESILLIFIRFCASFIFGLMIVDCLVNRIKVKKSYQVSLYSMAFIISVIINIVASVIIFRLNVTFVNLM